MSDTPNEPLTNTDGSQDNPQEPQVQSSEQPKEDMFSKAQLEEMLNKARKEEKDKLYKTLEKNKAKAQESAEERDRVQEELKAAKDRLKTLEDESLSDTDKINQQIKLLLEQNDLLKSKLDQVAKEGEARVRASELNAYRQSKIAESGILFPELVSGDTPEEIDASIGQILERESSIRNSVEDNVRKEFARNVPKPVSPGGESKQVSVDRYSISKKSPQEYLEIRKQLMARAMDSMRK